MSSYTNQFQIKNVSMKGLLMLCLLVFYIGLFPLIIKAQGNHAEEKKTNVVLIVADDLGWTGLGGYGSDLHETPNIDGFAKRSVKFTNAYSAAAICSPTRASIMTGKYPARLNMTTWHENSGPPKPNDENKLLAPTTIGNLPLEEVTIAEVFKESGYYTAHIGKWHLGEARYYPEAQGFDLNIGGTMWGMPQTYWYPYRGWRSSDQELRYVPGLEMINSNNERVGEAKKKYLTDHLTDKALEVIDAKKDVPFFLQLAYYTPHVPIEGKPELTEYFGQKVELNMHHKNPEYAAMIATLDENVGRILKKLEEVGVEDRTVVIFYSDNGGYIGERVNVEENYPLRSGKGSLYEGGIRVPLIIRWPGVTEPGGISEAPVTSNDFYPTLLEITGLKGDEEYNKNIDGISLVPVLRNPSANLNRQSLFWHFPHYYRTTPPVSAIRKGEWKLLHYFEDNHLELYNLEEDLGEMNNLVDQYSDKAQNLYQELKKWREQMDAKLPSLNPQYKPQDW